MPGVECQSWFCLGERRRRDSPSNRRAISVSSCLKSSDMVVLASLPIFSPAHWKARSNFLVMFMLGSFAVMVVWCKLQSQAVVLGW